MESDSKESLKRNADDPAVVSPKKKRKEKGKKIDRILKASEKAKDEPKAVVGKILITRTCWQPYSQSPFQLHLRPR